jgi:CubicO group peptidase (beta-lactamase class C family)
MSDHAQTVSHLNALAGGAKTPGLQYVVVTASDIAFNFAGGLADIRRQAIVDAGTTMMAYSMSKTITAVAVLQLVDEGKVGLDDSVEQYVDGLPYGPHVTVRQLISHTSGIPNPIPLRWVHPASDHAQFQEHRALAAILRKHGRLSFEPGTRYRYSNIGYWLLGSIIERASGEGFTTYVNAHIMRPLGIEPHELGYVVTDPTHHATGYLEKYSALNLVKGFLIDRGLIGEYSGRWLEIRSHYLNGPAFGGLVGSAVAFGRFLQDQLRSRSVLRGDEVKRLLYEMQNTADGRPIAMTLGWHIGDQNGTRFFFKEGGGGGFHCLMRLYPDRGIGTVVMANATGFQVKTLLDTLDPVFFGTPATGDRA